MKRDFSEPLNFSFTHCCHNEVGPNIPRLCRNTRRILCDKNEPHASLPQFVNAVDKILRSQESGFVQHDNHSELICLWPTRCFLVDTLKFLGDVGLAPSEDNPEILIRPQSVG